MEKIPLTARGFAKLDAELRQLKSVERPAVIAAIAEAREHGDLSENAEYHAAREKQSFIEGRIRELDATIGRSEVIDPSRFTGPVKFGATVVIVDEDTDEEKTFQIVGEQEASDRARPPEPQVAAGPRADRQGARRQRRGADPRGPALLRDPLRAVRVSGWRSRSQASPAK